MNQLSALAALACISYFFYLAWKFLVVLVTAPPGSLTEALASAELDEVEEERQRRRRLLLPDDDEMHSRLW